MTAGTDDCFAVVTNSLAAYAAACDIEPKPFQPIVTDWAERIRDHCGGAE